MSTRDDAFLDELMAELIAQRLEGRSPDVEALAAAHPDRAEQIRARVADLERLTALWHEMTATAGAARHKGRTLPPGTRMGEFDVVREIGRGGMGVVYLARQAALERNVALKVIPPAALSPMTRRRFLREAKALASLSHPNIVPVYTAGECEGTLYIAMEHVVGVPLSRIISAVRARSPGRAASDVWRETVKTVGHADVGGEAGPPSDPAVDEGYLAACLEAAAAVARALEAAHRGGIIHRDVKPANILIGPDGGVRLVDFGLAAVSAEPHVTLAGEFFGTPYYVSPEQARGRTDLVGVASDIYSLGATLYECIALAPPFEAPSAAEVLTKVISVGPPPLRGLSPAVPEDLEAMILKAMAKEPSRRHSSMGQFAEQIERACGQLQRRVRPASRLRRGARGLVRHPLAVGAIAMVLVAAYAGILAYLLRPRPEPPHQRATVPPRAGRSPGAVPMSQPTVTVRFSPAVNGTVVTGSTRKWVSCGDAIVLRDVSRDEPIKLRFSPDPKLVRGSPVEAPHGVSDPAGDVVPPGTKGTIVEVVKAAEMPGTVSLYRVRWEGRTTPQGEPVRGWDLRSVTPGTAYEVVTIDPAMCATPGASSHFLPRSRPVQTSGSGLEPDRPDLSKDAKKTVAVLAAALDGLAKVCDRTTGIRRTPIPGGSAEDFRLDQGWDLLGIRISRRETHERSVVVSSLLDVEVPFTPDGHAAKLTVHDFILLNTVEAIRFDYFAALRRHCSGKGVEILDPRQDDKEKGLWHVPVRAAGIVVYGVD